MGSSHDRPRLEIERLEQIIEATPVVVYALALERDALRPVWVCPNLERILGHPVREAFDRAWWINKVHPDDRDSVAHGRLEALEHGTSKLQYRVCDATGAYRWVQDELRRLDDVSPDGINVVGSWTDITERIRLEEELRHAQKMEAVGRLAAGFAHDFNNLIAVILAQCDAANVKEDAGGSLKAHVEEIGHSARRAAELTQELLFLGRKRPLTPERIDINELVRGETRVLERIAGADVQLEIRTRAHRSHATVDRVQLTQTLINLAMNARDAMTEGGVLRIETDNVDHDQGPARPVRPGSYITIRVSDTGAGIDQETRTRIFEPFFTTKEGGQGSGLGLAMVYKFAEQSGGTVTVDSASGRGSTFSLFLPVAPE